MPEATSQTQTNKHININSRFYRYMIDMKFALRECDFDDGVNFGEEISSDKDQETGGQFERVLLEVEEKRIAKDKLKEQAQSNTINAMAKSLRPHIIKHVKENMEDIGHTMEYVLRLPHNFSDLVDMLYSPSMTYSRVAAIIRLNHVHDSNLLHMVNRSDFQRQVGKPISNRIRDTQIAVSLLGIDGAKALLPVMMVKQTIKLRNEHFPLLGFKLWKLILANGLAAHHILTQKNYPDPVEGLLGGMLYHIGKISLYHQFVHSFDEVKKKFLIEFRRDNKKPQHDFLLKVEPDATILHQLMECLANKHTLDLVKALGMQKQRPKGLSMALEQALSISTIQQCSPVARAIRQGNAYAQLEQLRHAKLVGQENIVPFLDEVGMNKAGMSALIKRDLTRLDLKAFVE